MPGSCIKQLKRTDAYETYGMGAKLLRGMGWKEGDGLGKDNTGRINPIEASVATDCLGLPNSDATVRENSDRSPVVFVKAGEILR